MQRAGQIRLVGDELLEADVQPHRRPDRPVGVVLVRDRRAEQRDDRITQHLVDRAAERLDVDDEALECPIDHALQTLRIEVLRQAGVPDDVGEQHRDDTAFLRRRRDHLVTAERAEARIIGQRSQT